MADLQKGCQIESFKESINTKTKLRAVPMVSNRFLNDVIHHFKSSIHSVSSSRGGAVGMSS